MSEPTNSDYLNRAIRKEYDERKASNYKNIASGILDCDEQVKALEAKITKIKANRDRLVELGTSKDPDMNEVFKLYTAKEKY